MKIMLLLIKVQVKNGGSLGITLFFYVFLSSFIEIIPAFGMHSSSAVEENKETSSISRRPQNFALARVLYEITATPVKYVAGSLIKYGKMGIGFARATKAFKARGPEKLRLMTTYSGKKIFKGRVKPLSNEEDYDLSRKLYEHVVALSYKIGPRNFHEYPDNLLQARDYIINSLEEVKGYSIKTQKFKATSQEIKKCLKDNDYVFNDDESNPAYTYKGIEFRFKNFSTTYEFTNIIAEKEGTRAIKGKVHRIIIILAHYDTVNKSPGADDNGSSVAAALSLVKMFSNVKIKNTVRFVFVPNEEWPLSRTEYMGSLHYFRSLPQEEKELLDVIALDAIGYYTEDPNSQNLKLPILSQQYPNKTGNFVTFIGKAKNQETLKPEPLLIEAIRSFSSAGLIRSELLNAPIGIYGVHNKGCEDDVKTILFGDIIGLALREAGHSDHWSAWKEGISSAIMITDTAMARNPHYHQNSDTYETLNYTYLTRTVQSLFHMIRNLPYK